MTETGTDHHQREWTINDDIVRLRHWADDESYKLVRDWGYCLIGRGTGCVLVRRERDGTG
jgi:hypothetical protein